MTQPPAIPPSQFTLRPFFRWLIVIAVFTLLYLSVGNSIASFLFPTLRGGPDPRRVVASKMTHAVSRSIIDYLRTHDGQYPPALACLLVNHSLTSEQLVLPGGTNPFQPTSLPPESDWPLIAADVAAHSDFTYTGADLTMIRNRDMRYSDIIVFYSRLLPKNPYRFVGFADGHVTSINTDYDLLKIFATSNAARATLSLPPFTLDGPPPLPPPAPSQPAMEPRG